MRTLTIVSHTEHYKLQDGTLVGLGSTVTEINHLLEVFDSIIHVAMLHDTQAPPSTLPYISDKVSFVALPAVGGKNFMDKLKIVQTAPETLHIIRRSLLKADYFQFRAPTGIGVFVIPFLITLHSKKGWFKYAGNWKQVKAPIAYRLQRYLLKRQKRVVTINGHWLDEPEHCLTFENPCLTEKEILKGQSVTKAKLFNKNSVQLCFVGRLEDAKGLGILIDAISSMERTYKNQIEIVHIVGDGNRKQEYESVALKSGVSFMFHGFLSRSDVHTIYKTSHAIILPSASEGFPKVIAEAMNYGCLPIVSNVSSISHYIRDSNNGFLLDAITFENTAQTLKKFLQLSVKEYSTMIESHENRLHRFTYTYYNNRIVADIL